jgi:hypothetical protein
MGLTVVLSVNSANNELYLVADIVKHTMLTRSCLTLPTSISHTSRAENKPAAPPTIEKISPYLFWPEIPFYALLISFEIFSAVPLCTRSIGDEFSQSLSTSGDKLSKIAVRIVSYRAIVKKTMHFSRLRPLSSILLH